MTQKPTVLHENLSEATHDYFLYAIDKGHMDKCKQTGCS